MDQGVVVVNKNLQERAPEPDQGLGAAHARQRQAGDLVLREVGLRLRDGLPTDCGTVVRADSPSRTERSTCMLRYIVQRLLLLPVLILLFSIIVFWLVQAPPGDFLTSYICHAGLIGLVHGPGAGRCAQDAVRARPADSWSSTCAGWRACCTATGLFAGISASEHGTDRRAPGADDRPGAVRLLSSPGSSPYRPASIRRPTRIPSSITSLRSSTTSAWRRPTSCWR